MPGTLDCGRAFTRWGDQSPALTSPSGLPSLADAAVDRYNSLDYTEAFNCPGLGESGYCLP